MTAHLSRRAQPGAALAAPAILRAQSPAPVLLTGGIIHTGVPGRLTS